MTWDETATRKLKETTQLDKKIAVSPSRPMICSLLPSISPRPPQMEAA